MSSLSVSLPLTLDSGDGYTMNKTFLSLIKQNLKVICLTEPGERVMNPEFGAGLKRLLFDPYTGAMAGAANSAIRTQVGKYLPSVKIEEIIFDANPDTNSLSISIRYSIPTLNVQDLANITI